MTFMVMSHYTYLSFKGVDRNVNSGFSLSIILALSFTFLIGTRPISGAYFIDMKNYFYDYENLLGVSFHFAWDTTNLLFDNVFRCMASLYLPIEFFFTLIAAIYYICIHLACKRLFPKDTILSYLVYLGAFSSFSYGTNGIKAGAAAAIFLLALSYRKNKIIFVLLLLISLGFHHSMIVPLAASVIVTIKKSKKLWLYVWVVCLVMAALHITFFQELFVGFSDAQGAEYLDMSSKENIVSGFRPDFILYSFVPIYLGYYLSKKYHIKSDTYDFLWGVYILTNAMWLLCTYAEYTNRIAYLSWLMYPIVLLYPFVNFHWNSNVQYRYFQYAVYGHLGFTLIMFIVYIV